MPAAGPVTRWEADRSTPARWQYSSTTREPRSSPSRVDRPALTPIRLAALAAVTAPPQEIANSSAKISSPGAGRDGTSPKTISRNMVPKAITSMRPPSPEGLGHGVGPGDVAGGAVPGEQFPRLRRDPVALIDRERAPPPEPTAGCRVDDLGRLAAVGFRAHPQRCPGIRHRREQQLGVRVLGVGEHVLDRPGFGDLARVHDDQAVGDVPGAGEVVGDVEDRHPLGVAQPRHERSEEHTSELQSRPHLVCRLLLEKKKKNIDDEYIRKEISNKK